MTWSLLHRTITKSIKRVAERTILKRNILRMVIRARKDTKKIISITKVCMFILKFNDVHLNLKRKKFALNLMTYKVQNNKSIPLMYFTLFFLMLQVKKDITIKRTIKNRIMRRMGIRKNIMMEVDWLTCDFVINFYFIYTLSQIGGYHHEKKKSEKGEKGERSFNFITFAQFKVLP